MANPISTQIKVPDNKIKLSNKKTKVEMHPNHHDKAVRAIKEEGVIELAALSEVYGIDIEVLHEVWKRGDANWNATKCELPEDWAMARVRSFVRGGASALVADKDLWESVLATDAAELTEDYSHLLSLDEADDRIVGQLARRRVPLAEQEVKKRIAKAPTIKDSVGHLEKALSQSNLKDSQLKAMVAGTAKAKSRTMQRAVKRGAGKVLADREAKKSALKATVSKTTAVAKKMGAAVKAAEPTQQHLRDKSQEAADFQKHLRHAYNNDKLTVTYKASGLHWGGAGASHDAVQKEYHNFLNARDKATGKSTIPKPKAASAASSNAAPQAGKRKGLGTMFAKIMNSFRKKPAAAPAAGHASTFKTDLNSFRGRSATKTAHNVKEGLEVEEV